MTDRQLPPAVQRFADMVQLTIDRLTELTLEELGRPPNEREIRMAVAAVVRHFSAPDAPSLLQH